MRRLDTILVIIVGALAVFVTVMVANRPHRVAPQPTPAPSQAGATGTVAPHVEAAVAIVPSKSPPPVRDDAQIRARITETPGTYMPEMVTDLKGMLVRWPDRRQSGLRIWVQSMTSVPDWDQRYTQMARDAFDDWGRDPLPIRFDFVNDSATSDIRVVWVNHFAPDLGTRVGVTNRTSDQNGWLVSAQIDVAIHDSAGRSIPPQALEGIMRHEAGHALGMGHTRDQSAKMYPIEMARDISPADRATLRLLYQLPPGVVR